MYGIKDEETNGKAKKIRHHKFDIFCPKWFWKPHLLVHHYYVSVFMLSTASGVVYMALNRTSQIGNKKEKRKHNTKIYAFLFGQNRGFANVNSKQMRTATS